MKSKWKVSSNTIGGEKMYIVFRLRDVNEVDHSGNREYASEYMASALEAQAIADKFNSEVADNGQ